MTQILKVILLIAFLLICVSFIMPNYPCNSISLSNKVHTFDYKGNSLNINFFEYQLFLYIIYPFSVENKVLNDLLFKFYEGNKTRIDPIRSDFKDYIVKNFNDVKDKYVMYNSIKYNPYSILLDPNMVDLEYYNVLIKQFYLKNIFILNSSYPVYLQIDLPAFYFIKKDNLIQRFMIENQKSLFGILKQDNLIGEILSYNISVVKYVTDLLDEYGFYSFYNICPTDIINIELEYDWEFPESRVDGISQKTNYNNEVNMVLAGNIETKSFIHVLFHELIHSYDNSSEYSKGFDFFNYLRTISFDNTGKPTDDLVKSNIISTLNTNYEDIDISETYAEIGSYLILTRKHSLEAIYDDNTNNLFYFYIRFFINEYAQNISNLKSNYVNNQNQTRQIISKSIKMFIGNIMTDILNTYHFQYDKK